MDNRRKISVIAVSTNGHGPNRIIPNNEEHNLEIDAPSDMIMENLPTYRPTELKSLGVLPDSILISVFAYLTPIDLIRCTHVCHRWHLLVSHHQQLWRRLFLRPDCSNGFIGAVHVRHIDKFISMIGTRCASALVCIDLPVELITVEILRVLANHCPNLEYLTLDFSSAMQLHDFNDLNEFPCNLKRLCVCLSEVIFLEAFMRRIYGYISSLNTLHIIGTMEKSSIPSPEETDTYETINISKIKTHAPNLRIINLYGIGFIDDNHIELIASGCMHLQCLALNFCVRVRGTSFKNLMNRCAKLQCLLLQNTGIEDEAMLTVNWSSTQLTELDISSTELTEKGLLEFFSRVPKLTYLAVSYCDGFTDKVLQLLMERGTLNGCRALDLSNTVNLNVETTHHLLISSPGVTYRLEALNYTGCDAITEQFWIDSIRFLHRIKILIIGTAHSWFRQMSRRIHIDQILESCAIHCPHLKRFEIQWDPETLRFSENSSKFIDHLRVRCTNLLSFVLSDGPYYEGTKANFERAERFSVVRTTTMYQTNGVYNSQNDRIWAANRAAADDHGGVKRKRKFPTKVMVWLGACSAGLTPLVILDKTSVNHEIYIKEVLPVALNFGNKMLGDQWTYQQEAATPHTHQLTQEWCARHFASFMPKDRRPANSPDLNPLDYCICNELVQAMDWGRVQTKLTLIEELKRSVKKIKPEIVLESCNNFSKRLCRVLENEGRYLR
ncbi:unnamed protein product [Rotaria magnacalcarata]|uniref:F-box domain-containing protein n=1 Tax=Rotaria magnacalcarata TaxID=392030 RepID=A0A816S225_9BILA|nr:unnamed protein product [Rotaria magnacalcarata]